MSFFPASGGGEQYEDVRVEEEPNEEDEEEKKNEFDWGRHLQVRGRELDRIYCQL